MVVRASGAEAQDRSGSGRKSTLRERVWNDVPVGLLAYEQGEPVGWCSIAPKSTYSRTLREAGTPGEPDERVWSLACFFVARRLRGRGVARQLRDAAVAHARANGATAVEAYPVDPDSPSFRFMGYVSLFDEAGFREVATLGKRRHVMRLHLE